MGSVLVLRGVFLNSRIEGPSEHPKIHVNDWIVQGFQSAGMQSRWINNWWLDANDTEVHTIFFGANKINKWKE
jgi:hypothetical protein